MTEDGKGEKSIEMQNGRNRMVHTENTMGKQSW